MNKTDPLRINISPLRVLLVEDDPGDVLIIKEALAEGDLDHDIDVVTNGEEALAYLHRRGPYADTPSPHVVLLDLNLPRVGGREVLADVKADPALRHLPIIVLTTSDAEADVVASYGLHANAYVTKPVDVDAFQDVIRNIDRFFLDVVRLPGR